MSEDEDVNFFFDHLGEPKQAVNNNDNILSPPKTDMVKSCFFNVSCRHTATLAEKQPANYMKEIGDIEPKQYSLHLMKQRVKRCSVDLRGLTAQPGVSLSV